jgi:hypothetical protein
VSFSAPFNFSGKREKMGSLVSGVIIPQLLSVFKPEFAGTAKNVTFWKNTAKSEKRL